MYAHTAVQTSCDIVPCKEYPNKCSPRDPCVYGKPPAIIWSLKKIDRETPVVSCITLRKISSCYRTTLNLITLLARVNYWNRSLKVDGNESPICTIRPQLILHHSRTVKSILPDGGNRSGRRHMQQLMLIASWRRVRALE